MSEVLNRFPESWKVVRLSDVADFQNGHAFYANGYSNSGLIALDLYNISEDGRLRFGERDKYVSHDLCARFSKFKLNRGDLVIAMTDMTQRLGILGKSAVVDAADRYILNQRVGRIVPNEHLILTRYLHYFINSQYFLEPLKALAKGAVQKYVNTGDIKDNFVAVPPLPIQRRIVSILAAYDDLIENNQRRIKILEEMARSLYREWFIDFRFPGHEKVLLVDAPLGKIPKGWEVKTVSESFEICGGGTPSRKEPAYWENGTIHWYAPSDLTGAGTMFMDVSGEKITTRGLAESSARLFPARSVMLTSRATIGAIAINTYESCTNQGFITCLPNEHVPLFFLYHWLKENVSQFQRLASGATFKEISRGVFKTIQFLHPPLGLVTRFELSAAPLCEQIQVFQRQITNLRCTRDLLLPRLLSGSIKFNHVSTERDWANTMAPEQSDAPSQTSARL